MSISSEGSLPTASTTTKRGKLHVSRKLKYPKDTTKCPESVPSFQEDSPELVGSTCSSLDVILNIGIFQGVLDCMAKCSCCSGRLELVATKTISGSASFLSMKCSTCESLKKFWSVGGYSHEKLKIGSSEIPKRNSTVYCSVLAGRLMGIGWHKLFLYHSMMSTPGPGSQSTFGIAQTNILVAAEATAVESMENARDELRTVLHTDPSSQHVTTIGTFDGAYQQRTGKSGGGFSRYCFAAAIIAQTGKIIAYDIA